MKLIAIGDFHGKFPKKLQNRIKREKPDAILCTGDLTGLQEWIPLERKRQRLAIRGKEVPTIKELLGKQEYNELIKRDWKAGVEILKILNRFSRTILIFGNGDWYSELVHSGEFPKNKYYETYGKRFKNIKQINRSKTRFKKLKVVGFGGYFDPDIYLDRKVIKRLIKKYGKIKRRYNKRKKQFMNLIKYKPDIVLLHYPLIGYFDKIKEARKNPLNGKSVGVSYFNQGIKKFRPFLVVMGHMHEYQGMKKLGKSIIVNPGPAYEGKAAIIQLDEDKKKVNSIKFIR